MWLILVDPCNKMFSKHYKMNTYLQRNNEIYLTYKHAKYISYFCRMYTSKQINSIHKQMRP